MVSRARTCCLATTILLSGVGLALGAPANRAHVSPDHDVSLAKKLQNPVAKFISLPLENDTKFGVGADNQVANTLNTQAVIPVPLGLLNLITRTVLPVAFLPSSATGTGEDAFGLGDLTTTWFLSPAQPCMLTWGVGPVWYFPTASSDLLGTDQFGVGPSLVVLASPGRWVFGAQFGWIWSFAGPADRPDVNRTEVQYFINYNLPHGWYISVAPRLTGDWEIKQGNKWTVPFGGGVGKVLRMGPTALNIQVHGYGNVVKPTGGASATLRVQLQFVLPSFY